MSLFKELSRRNVIRVGIAYLISGWVILQVADVVLENIGAPPWVIQTIMLVLALGFPAALIFAWAFEVTPEGIKREAEVDRTVSITGVTGRKLDRAIIVLLVVAVAYFAYQSGSGRSGNDVPGAADLSIAVLPFDNRSNQDEDSFFTEGIHDDLLTTLSRIESLKVISRTSVMQYRDTVKSVPEIARELGVTKILEGGVQRSGDMVRINVQLIEAATDEHLWAEIYDRELTAENLFAIQTEVSRAIAAALRATLTADDERRIDTAPTDNLDAYDAYWRGRQLSDTRETARLERAVEHYRRATELDPEFALAWVAIADTYYWLSSYGSYRTSETIDHRRVAIDRALAINPELGEAYASLGALQRSMGEHEDAEAAFLKSIELSPNYATAYHWYSFFLSDDRTRRREALEYGLLAAELNPHSSAIGTNLAQVYLYLGDNAAAVETIDKVLEVDPGFAYAHLVRSRALARLGDLESSIQAAQRAVDLDPGSPFNQFFYIAWLAQGGAIDQARTAFAAMREVLPNHLLLRRANLEIQMAVGNERAMRQLLVPFLRSERDQFMILAGLDGMLALRDLDGARLQVDKLLTAIGEDGVDEFAVEDPDGICIAAWVLARTGDEMRAQHYAELGISTIENRLRPQLENSDGYTTEVCQLALGRSEEALQELERRFGHNRISAPLWLERIIFDDVRDEPRFVDLYESSVARFAEARRALGYEQD